MSAELKARLALDAAKYEGIKPLVVWYAFWTALCAISAVYGLATGAVGGAAVAAVLMAVAAAYTVYLYNGGRRRVWFFII